jgi:arylsulfatase A-like enzyme
VRVGGFNQHKDLVPTLLELAGVPRGKFTIDGQSLSKLVNGKMDSFESSFYITECTWMRKHGWRTPQWKLIEALEPDFHFKPAVELYNLVEDPDELHNVARRYPEVVAMLREQMNAFIGKREKQLKITNPMHTQGDWHGHKGVGSFKTSEQAYDTMRIGTAATAKALQEKKK